MQAFCVSAEAAASSLASPSVELVPVVAAVSGVFLDVACSVIVG